MSTGIGTENQTLPRFASRLIIIKSCISYNAAFYSLIFPIVFCCLSHQAKQLQDTSENIRLLKAGQGFFQLFSFWPLLPSCESSLRLFLSLPSPLYTGWPLYSASFSTLQFSSFSFSSFHTAISFCNFFLTGFLFPGMRPVQPLKAFHVGSAMRVTPT